MLQANLKRAFPLTEDDQFTELLVALDRKVPGPASVDTPRKRSRVLPLAVLAVVLTLVLARVAAEAVWELSGKHYVDDVVRHELQKDRTTPAVS
jgi:hypothetical protein